MTDADKIIDEIRKQKPEISREEIKAIMEAKKEKLGSYLTDSGAAFLAAHEFAVSIGNQMKTSVSIKELYAGASEVTLEARVMCVAPIRQFTRKDGGQGALRTMSIYDSPRDTASVKMWDEKASRPDVGELKPGDFIKITKAFIKEDRDGSLAIHVGSNAEIEKIDTLQRPIPPISEITIDVGRLAERMEGSAAAGGGGSGDAAAGDAAVMGESNLAVSGIMEGGISLMEYTRKNSGEGATALKLRLSGYDGVSRKIVLWGKNNSSIPKRIVSTTPKVTLLGVSARMSEQQGFEIHGNESTYMMIEGDTDSDGSMEAVTIRIIAKPPITDGSNKQYLLGVDATKRLYTITDTGQVTAAYNEGEIVECMPAQIHGSMVTLDGSSSYMRSADGGGGGGLMIPTIHDIKTQLMDAKPDGKLYCIDCIVIVEPIRKEIQTRNNDTVHLTEAGIADKSGERTLKAWRNQARLLDECRIGSMYIVAGVRAQRGMGSEDVDFTLTEYSTITKITGAEE